MFLYNIYLPARGQLEVPSWGQTDRAARNTCSDGRCSIGTALYVTMHCKDSILDHPCCWCSRRSGYSPGSPSSPPTWSDCQNTVQWCVANPPCVQNMSAVRKNKPASQAVRRLFLMQLHQQAKSTHSTKSPLLLNQWCDLDALPDLESPK